MASVDDQIGSRDIQAANIGGTAMPFHALPVIIKNNSQLAQKPTTRPPAPQVSAPLSGIPLGFQFSYNQLTSPTIYGNTIDSYRIYRNTSANSFSGSQLIRTIRHDPTHLGAVTVQDSVTGGKQFYYFITAVDTTGQESSQANAFQSSAVTSGNANPNVVTVNGSTSDPTTSSTSYAVIPEMTITLTTKGHNVLILWTGVVASQTGGAGTLIQVFRDGVGIGSNIFVTTFGTVGSLFTGATLTVLDPSPSAGSHTYDIRWRVDSNPHVSQCSSTLRQMQVVELG